MSVLKSNEILLHKDMLDEAMRLLNVIMIARTRRMQALARGVYREEKKPHQTRADEYTLLIVKLQMKYDEVVYQLALSTQYATKEATKSKLKTA